MKVSVIVASCGRPYLFLSMFRSLINTTEGFDIEPVFVIDDFETMKTFSEYIIPSHFVLDYSENRRGALWAWNRGLEISTGSIIVPAGDDQRFYVNWLDYALTSHREKLGGYGVVGMNDLAYNENQVATMILFDRQYCKDHMGGVIAPPVYKYYCIDSEWNEKAKILGRFYRDMRAKVEHIHSAHGKRPLDDLDREKIDAEWMKIDNEVFENRKANNFPVTWEPVI